MHIKRRVVVFTDPKDAHIPFVQKYLDNPMIIFDPQLMLEGTDLSFEVKRGKAAVSYKGVSLDSVSGVWYRKPQDITLEQLRVPEELAVYSLSSIQNHQAMALSALPNALWVSDYFAIRRASSKVLQLEVAERIGFLTPRTLMTSDPDKARAFIEKEGTCVVKAQCAYSPSYTGPVKSFLTTKVTKDSPPDFTNIHLAPPIFQQYIDTVFDVRVTVIGEEVFPAIIRPRSEDAQIRDWRIDFFEDKGPDIEAYQDFPKDVARMCVEHSKKLGLNFSAIDLVMDKKGKLWFLENNANGQWAFVEKLTGQPIGSALARLLVRGKVL